MPAAVDAFVGRGEEVAGLGALLERSRLITLTGPPGIGKTRLGLEVARERADRYREGAVLVELAAISDPALVPRTVAAALSVQEVAGQSHTEVLVGHLRRRSLLIVLDNCEHVLLACARLVEALLRGCPELRVLATSREPLLIAGERVWQVPSLSTPDGHEDRCPEALVGSEAVRLFVERAGAVKRGFELDADVAPAVAEITRRLDGIPLALELAAARLELLSAAEIARYLDRRFALLSNGVRTGVARHRTLVAALDWSHGLLSEPERALLRRLSVFAAAFDLEAAGAVCAGEPIEHDDVFGVLGRLVSKSLVVADTAGSRGRYRLLETIRAYGADRLQEADEAASLGEAHARFYLTLAAEAEPHLAGPDQLEWFERLDVERENLRAALVWSLANDRPVRALRLAGALVLFWRVRCHFTEGRELLDSVVTAGRGGPEDLLATALWGSGFLALMLGDMDAATAALEESLARFRAIDDVRGCARALMVLGNLRMCVSNRDGVRMLEESAVLAREAGDAWCLSHALALAGIEQCMHADLSVARPLFEEALIVSRAAQDKQGLRFALLGLGQVSLRQGDYRSAERLLEETAGVNRELGDNPNTAVALMHVADLAFGRGQYPRARIMLEEAMELLGERSSHDIYLQMVERCARVAHAEGDLPRARARLDELAARAPGRVSCELLLWTGELAADVGEFGRGRGLFEQALTCARSIQNRGYTASALYCLGQLARVERAFPRATALHNEALDLHRELDAPPAVVASIEALAGLSAALGRHRHAARLLGAARTVREREGYARVPWECARYEADVACVRDALPAEQFESAWADGTGLSISEAAIQAAKGRRQRGRPSTGWQSLTETEQRVATMVADGLTNPEIAQRLFITPGTARNHVSHILGKLGVTRRTQIPRRRR